MDSRAGLARLELLHGGLRGEGGEVDGTVGDKHLVQRQGARLIGADDGHGAERLNGLEGLAEDLVLLHDVGSDCQARGYGDWEALGDEGDGDAHAADDEGGHADPVRMFLAEPASPEALS